MIPLGVVPTRGCWIRAPRSWLYSCLCLGAHSSLPYRQFPLAACGGAGTACGVLTLSAPPRGHAMHRHFRLPVGPRGEMDLHTCSQNMIPATVVTGFTVRTATPDPQSSNEGSRDVPMVLGFPCMLIPTPPCSLPFLHPVFISSYYSLCEPGGRNSCNHALSLARTAFRGFSTACYATICALRPRCFVIPLSF